MGARGPAPKDKLTVAYRDGVPPAPDWLSQEGADEYARVVAEMEAAKVAPQQVDHMVLARYAHAASEFAKLVIEIAKQGYTVPTAEGIKQNPLCRSLEGMGRMMDAAEKQLGFTPAARCRLPKSGATGKSDNPFAAHINSTQ